MAEFYTGEFGPARPLEITMPFDPTIYTTITIDITKPDSSKISVVPTSQTTTYLRYTPTSTDWSVSGTYDVQITCSTPTNKRRARATFTVDA